MTETFDYNIIDKKKVVDLMFQKSKKYYVIRSFKDSISYCDREIANLEKFKSFIYVWVSGEDSKKQKLYDKSDDDIKGWKDYEQYLYDVIAYVEEHYDDDGMLKDTDDQFFINGNNLFECKFCGTTFDTRLEADIHYENCY